MVATFHIWFDRVSGGVDIFLLVSAFLLTRSLTARSETASFTRPITYLTKKFARLLPAAVTVITLILIGVFALLPAANWSDPLGSAFSSLFYTENLRLQDNAVNYFNPAGNFASPFQHFWSLSVQGQIFVLFALIHVFGDLLARTWKISVRKVLFVVFALCTVTSFAYSVWLTQEQQEFAYFDTWARLWEFGVGSLLAIVSPWLRITAWVRAAFSWVGITAMLSCGFIVPVESSFPGVAALWPVAAATLIILSAGTPTSWGADRLLAHTALQRVGGYTYALYLTHWPVLILCLFLADVPAAGPRLGLLVLTISAVLSIVIVHLIERPVASWVARETPMRARWQPQFGWRSPVTILASIALVLTSIGAGNMMLNREVRAANAAVAALDVSRAGANAPATTAEDHAPVPAPVIVTSDWAPSGPDCTPTDPYRTGMCYELPAPTGPAEHTIFAIGSSHTAQFTGALAEAVNRHPQWEFRTQVSPGCYYQTRSDVGPECVELWEQSARYIAAEHPDLVVVFGTQTYLDFEMTQPDFVEWIAQAQATSPTTQFVALRDNPRAEASLFECAMQNGFTSDHCVWGFVTETPPDYIAALENIGVLWVDLNEFICPDGICRPVQGGVVTYLDAGHLTATYTRTLAQHFSAAITPEVSWWPQYVYREGIYRDRITNDTLLNDLNN